MVKESQKSNIDKEYSMEISANCDTHVRLFCRGMNTDYPKEYITLFALKENFANVHDYKQPSASKDSCVKANGKKTLVFITFVSMSPLSFAFFFCSPGSLLPSFSRPFLVAVKKRSLILHEFDHRLSQNSVAWSYKIETVSTENGRIEKKPSGPGCSKEG